MYMVRCGCGQCDYGTVAMLCSNFLLSVSIYGDVLVQSFGASLEAAKNSFTTLYRDKTSNEWGMEGMKRPGKFYPLEIDYGQEDSAGHLDAEEVGSTSKLAPEVQQLVRTIFDVESMKNAMREFEVRVHDIQRCGCFLCIDMCSSTPYITS